MRLHKLICVLLAIALAVGLAGCGKKAKEPTAAQAAKRDELAQQFMTEIRDDILPFKGHVSLIGTLGILVSEDERVADFTLLDAFVDSYRAGGDCNLTACFVTKSFVVARLVVLDGTGYYFRYEYDAKNPIAVSSKVFDDLQITEDDTGKVQLKLAYDGIELVTFTFRPVVEDTMPPEPDASK